MEYVEEASKAKILRSCEELARHGVRKNGDYLVDPDGELLSQDPIMVHCIFNEGPAITEISHYHEKPIIVDHCDSKGCFEQSIEYNVPLAQIEALISLSESCSQHLDFGCFLAPLITNDDLLGGWKNRKGKRISLISVVL